jgi:signal transduction histidine kinase
MSAHNAASCELPETAARSIATIQRSAKVMQSMIRDLLDFAGSRLGREMPMRAREANLVDACRDALAEVMAAHPRRRFQLEHEGDLRGVFDPERIGQALSNLLNNAINHGNADRLVEMRAREEREELVVDVINEGEPIPADLLHALLDPALRAPGRAGEGSSGLGLGLYIAQQVARAHGGSVTAASEDQKIRFSLRLPRKRGAPATNGK